LHEQVQTEVSLWSFCQSIALTLICNPPRHICCWLLPIYHLSVIIKRKQSDINPKSALVSSNFLFPLEIKHSKRDEFLAKKFLSHIALANNFQQKRENILLIKWHTYNLHPHKTEEMRHGGRLTAFNGVVASRW
jgi:hypothetical protein